jgi:acetoin utilization deacetylase AcuC-like enzyme
MGRRVRALADELGVPLGAVLEGGYDLRALALSTAATLEAMRDGGAPDPAAPHPLAAQAAASVGRYWPLPIATS